MKHNVITLISYLNSKERKHLLILIFLIIISVVLEALSIGILIPAIIYLTSSADTIIPGIWRNYSDEKLAILFFAFLSILFTVKFFYSMFLIRFQSSLSYGIMSRLSATLFNYYALTKYSLTGEKNTSEVLRNVIREPTHLVGGVLMPLITIITELSIMFGIFLILIFYSAIPTIIMYYLSYL